MATSLYQMELEFNFRYVSLNVRLTEYCAKVLSHHFFVFCFQGARFSGCFPSGLEQFLSRLSEGLQRDSFVLFCFIYIFFVC